MKIQLNLPWFDIKFPYGFEDHKIYMSDETDNQYYKVIKLIYLDTTIYDSISDFKYRIELFVL